MKNEEQMNKQAIRIIEFIESYCLYTFLEQTIINSSRR